MPRRHFSNICSLDKAKYIVAFMKEHPELFEKSEWKDKPANKMTKEEVEEGMKIIDACKEGGLVALQRSEIYIFVYVIFVFYFYL